MDDVVGGDSSSPKRMPKQSGQKTKQSGNSSYGTVTGKKFPIAKKGHIKGNEKRDRNSIRCSFCGSLCETNSFKEHVFFCRQEHEKSAKIAKPPLIKILKVKKTVVSEEIKEARRIERNARRNITRTALNARKKAERQLETVEQKKERNGERNEKRRLKIETAKTGEL